jgi:hypothetical protein
LGLSKKLTEVIYVYIGCNGELDGDFCYAGENPATRILIKNVFGGKLTI